MMETFYCFTCEREYTGTAEMSLEHMRWAHGVASLPAAPQAQSGAGQRAAEWHEWVRDKNLSRIEQARHLKAHYAEISVRAMDSYAMMPSVIDAWAREPDLLAERDQLRRDLAAARAALADVAELLDDVWAQFATPGKGGRLWAGGLSTLEDVEAMRAKLAAFKVSP